MVLATKPRTRSIRGRIRDNPVDAEVLFELSDGDLARLGVLLGGRTPTEGDGELASVDKSAPTSLAPSTTAERCQLTVMFCDLVPLSARLDPEDMRRVIRVYQDAMGSPSRSGFVLPHRALGSEGI